MKVFVTQKHIGNGLKRDCIRCPAALAILEQCQVDKVEVGGIFIKYWKEGGPLSNSLEIPSHLSQFIQNFDEGEPVAPIDFEIDLPERK